MASSHSPLNNNSSTQASGDGSDREPSPQELLLVDLYWRRALWLAHAKALGGLRVLAPVDISAAAESLKIFDVHCGDGSWLVDLDSSSASSSSSVLQQRPQHQVVGGRSPNLLPFPWAFPPNVSMVEVDVKRDWPKDMHGKFDLANMAYMLPPTSIQDINPLKTIVRQVALLKPGGWLQVTEMVPRAVQEGEDTSAMGIVWGVRAAGTDAAATILERPTAGEICRDLESWIKDAGLETIESRDVTAPIGMRSGVELDKKEEELAKAIAKGWKVIVANDAKGVPKMMDLTAQALKKRRDLVVVHPPLPMDELPTAGDRVEQLLLSEGDEQLFRTVWGRKPLPSGV